MPLKPKGKEISASPEAHVLLRGGDNAFTKTRISVDFDDFYDFNERSASDAYLIVGFDTEFKSLIRKLLSNTSML